MNTEYRIQNTEYRIQNTEYRMQNAVNTVSRDWNPDLIHKVEKYSQYQHVLVWGFYSAAIRGECPAVISRKHIADWLATTEFYKNKKERTTAADQQVVEYIYQKLIEIHDSAAKSKIEGQQRGDKVNASYNRSGRDNGILRR